MRTLIWALVISIAFVGGWTVGANRSRASLKRQTQELHANLAFAQQAYEEATIERDSWKSRAAALETSVSELHRLRAEVSRLKKQPAQPPGGSAPANAGQPPAVAAPVQNRKGVIPLESAPPAVAAAIAAHAENGRVKVGLHRNDDGRLTFGVKGELPDGRGIALRLAEDGALLEKSTELRADAIPPHIQAPVLEAFGNVPISGGREIIEGERLMYEIVSKGPDARMQITVRSDGAILGYAAKLSVQEP